MPGPRGALWTPTRSCVSAGTLSSIRRRGEGCGTSRIPDNRSCSNPIPTDPDTVDREHWRVSTLASMVQGEVLTLSMHKAGKMNGQGPEGSKS